MAFTGELEQLHIVDILQLLNTTRKSGTLSVKGARGESRIIFSNGHIVGASHLNKVRIGTVLVKMNAITLKDLDQALEIQKKAGSNRKPLIAALIDLGRLGRDEAALGLKKLIEMTLVELIGWTKGTFTLDTESIVVSSECSYPISKMEQELSLDAQMALMDALRIFDERERDRQSGKTVPPDEELFEEVLPSKVVSAAGAKGQVLTADDLGLGDLEHLERKMPEFLPVNEIFDPVEIHRQKIKETLASFSAEEQETFVSFLGKSTISIGAYAGPTRQEGRTKALILFSEDDLIKHSVMTICKDEGVMVFATGGEKELERIIGQCLSIKILPIVVFDAPETQEGMLSKEKIISLRQRVKDKYSQVSILQAALPQDYAFTLESFKDSVRAVFPKPSKETGKATFIADTIIFLETFKAYITDMFHGQNDPAAADNKLSRLKDAIMAIRSLNDPPALSRALLQYVSEVCERAITFIVRPAELMGEKAIGVYAEKTAGPTPATGLKITLTRPSVFREVIEKGERFYGDSDSEVLRTQLFEAVGAPLKPTIILLPMKVSGKVVALTYGDFGGKEASPIQNDVLEILANEAGMVLENMLYRKQLSKASIK
ncbi:MAG: DUF4388 domain-containing protein [Nitrospirae bacterium]|nr:MAG: DUF4388 domain-containing protein [Nitrospirota bacterium]